MWYVNFLYNVYWPSLESCENDIRILERTNKYFLTVWHFVHSALAFKVLAILFSHKFIARLIHLCAVATNWKEDIASYKPFCPQQWMGERTNKHESPEENELSPITLLVFTCILVPLSPRSICVREVLNQAQIASNLIWLGIRNKYSAHDRKFRSRQRLRCLWLTKEISASEDKYGWSLAWLICG